MLRQTLLQLKDGLGFKLNPTTSFNRFA